LGWLYSIFQKPSYTAFSGVDLVKNTQKLVQIFVLSPIGVLDLLGLWVQGSHKQFFFLFLSQNRSKYPRLGSLSSNYRFFGNILILYHRKDLITFLGLFFTLVRGLFQIIGLLACNVLFICLSYLSSFGLGFDGLAGLSRN